MDGDIVWMPRERISDTVYVPKIDGNIPFTKQDMKDMYEEGKEGNSK